MYCHCRPLFSCLQAGDDISITIAIAEGGVPHSTRDVVIRVVECCSLTTDGGGRLWFDGGRLWYAPDIWRVPVSWPGGTGRAEVIALR